MARDGHDGFGHALRQLSDSFWSVGHAGNEGLDQGAGVARSDRGFAKSNPFESLGPRLGILHEDYLRQVINDFLRADGFGPLIHALDHFVPDQLLFVRKVAEHGHEALLLVAAGSGITPLFSIIKHTQPCP